MPCVNRLFLSILANICSFFLSKFVRLLLRFPFKLRIRVRYTYRSKSSEYIEWMSIVKKNGILFFIYWHLVRACLFFIEKDAFSYEWCFDLIGSSQTAGHFLLPLSFCGTVICWFCSLHICSKMSARKLFYACDHSRKWMHLYHIFFFFLNLQSENWILTAHIWKWKWADWIGHGFGPFDKSMVTGPKIAICFNLLLLQLSSKWIWKIHALVWVANEYVLDTMLCCPFADAYYDWTCYSWIISYWIGTAYGPILLCILYIPYINVINPISVECALTCCMSRQFLSYISKVTTAHHRTTAILRRDSVVH